GDGCWACVDSNGLLSVTDSSSVTKVLNGDGTWVALVPREEQSEPVPEEEPVENAQPAAVRTEKEEDPVQESEPEPEPEPEVQYHTVQSGDTLYKLARRYGTTVAEICRLNRIKEDSVIKIGQKLRVK
ncbi:MAG: LysM peptidoglycan-binding domain-containing protein, partial [Bacteroidales bacterium]|nr:LysM peptidoglycan-binding domain-containing protein [Bacteroidales bacterium]